MADSFCSGCGTALKPGARFCENCGKPATAALVAIASPTPVAARPTVTPASVVAPERLSADGKWRWDGRQWVAVPQAAETAPGGGGKAKKGKNPVLIVVLVVGLAAFAFFVSLAVMRSVNNPGGTASTAPARTLGPGPYYLHFNCNNDSACMGVFGGQTQANTSEAVSNKGNTGIYDDFSDKASCDSIRTTVASAGNTWWCSTSKNPADTKP